MPATGPTEGTGIRLAATLAYQSGLTSMGDGEQTGR
jgi:hypothetical protein